MAELTPNCFWCGTPLKGHSLTEFKDTTTFVGSCPKCGDYTMMPDLVAAADTLSAGKRAFVQEYLSDTWELLGDHSQLTLHFVANQLGEKKL